MKQLFISLQDRIFEKAKKSAPMYRWGLTVCFLFLIVGIYLLVIRYPLGMHIASKRLAVKQICKQLSYMHETEAELLAMERMHDEMRGIFAKKAFNGSFNHVLALLFSFFNTAQLSIKQYHFKECMQKKDWCKKYELTICFSGAFSAIQTFYAYLQQIDAFLFIKNIKIEHWDKEQQRYMCTTTCSFVELV